MVKGESVRSARKNGAAGLGGGAFGGEVEQF
jgi:hypothetical protein